MQEEDSDSWIDRVAEAATKRKGKETYEQVLAVGVQRYEDSVDYLAAIGRSLKEGKSVSVWELLDAALGAAGENHPYEEDAAAAVRAFQGNQITKEECSKRLSQTWAEIVARRDALKSIDKTLIDCQLGVEAFSMFGDIPLNKSERFSDWRKFTPIRGR